MSTPNRMMFLRLNLACRQTVLDALNAAGFHGEALSVAEFTRDYADEAANAECERWIEIAESVREDGKIEIDDDSTISHSDAGGQYMLAWVWVDDPNAEEGEDDE